jgi:carbon monoxide dehydrogenase subunit G
MRLQGSVEVALGRAELYARLSDPRRLEDALPAVLSVELDGDDRFTAHVAPATALGPTPLRLAVGISERREGEHVRLDAVGDAAEYGATIAIELDFADAGAGAGTQVRWQGEGAFRGALSSLGQRVLPQIVERQLRQVVQSAAEADATPARG